MTETVNPDSTVPGPGAPDPGAAVRAMIDQWVSLSTALAGRTPGAGGGPPLPFDLREVATKLLGAVNLPTRDEVLDLHTAVAALDARLARIEAALAAMAPNPVGPRSAGLAHPE